MSPRSRWSLVATALAGLALALLTTGGPVSAAPSIGTTNGPISCCSE